MVSNIITVYELKYANPFVCVVFTSALMVFAKMLCAKHIVNESAENILDHGRAVLNKAAAALEKLDTKTELVIQCIRYIKYLAQVQDNHAPDAAMPADSLDTGFGLNGFDAFLSQGGDLGMFLPSELIDFSLMDSLTTNFD